MKVIIDLIEDIQTAVADKSEFSLVAMQLQENTQGEFVPAGESNVCDFIIDDEAHKLSFVLGKEEALSLEQTFEQLNALSNEKMMYETLVQYGDPQRPTTQAIIGFGEARDEQNYFLFINA